MMIGQDLHLVVASNVLLNKSVTVLKNLSDSLKPGGFVLLEESTSVDGTPNVAKNLVFVAKQAAQGKSYLLFKKREEKPAPIVIQITEKNYQWLEGVKAALKKTATENQEILIVGQGEDLLGKYEIFSQGVTISIFFIGTFLTITIRYFF